MQKLMKLSVIRKINSLAINRHLSAAFNEWKFETLLEKKAMNKKLQMLFLNNAKIEVERNKNVLKSLYLNKQL